MKKSHVSRELANTFPSWSRTSADEQSVGFRFLNTLASPMGKMDKSLAKMKANQYLTTANLDEIDIVYKVSLPANFEFDYDTSDPNVPVPVSPTVSGVIGSDTYNVTITDENTVESFWYNSTPTRVSLEDVVSGTDYDLLDCTAADLPQSGVFQHHLSDGGHLWVETSGGSQYLEFEKGILHRARLIIHGTTRKGTQEYEQFTFPWDMKQKSKKEWKTITNVECVNFEDTVQVNLYSADYNASDYLDQWNLGFSENRNKIDTFWGLGGESGVVTLDLIEYITDEWQQLVLGSVDKQTRVSWELLDDSMQNVSGVDMTLQPFSDRAWVVTTDNMLYCYNIEEDMVSGVDLLRDRTPGSNVQIDMEFKHVVLGEDIEFLPWHARPLKAIKKYRLWYQTPSGTKYGLSNGSPVAFTSDFWVIGEETISRTVENLIRVQATERGEYLFVLEVVFIDDEEHNDRVICSVECKQPIVSFDLSSIVTENLAGIDFDSDQKMWVRTATDYYQINLHTDVMLIDYEGKAIYFKEDYDSVEVITDG